MNTTRSCWTETHKPAVTLARSHPFSVRLDGATVRVDASLTAIIILVVVVVMYRECKANWYRDISQRLPPLSADCTLAVVYLWPGYYRRPATQDLEVGVPGTPCRAAVPLRYAKQAERVSRLLLRFHENRPLWNERKIPSHSRMFLAGFLDSLEGGSILETTETRRLSLCSDAPPKTCPHPIFYMSDSFSRLGKPVLFLTLSIKDEIGVLESQFSFYEIIDVEIQIIKKL